MAVAAVALVCFIIASLVDVEVHQKALSIFMYLLALIPIILAILMLMVLLYAFYMVYTRRDNIKLAIELKNKDSLEVYGVKLQPSDNYEWIVAHIQDKKAPGQVSLSSETKIKIGPKKDSTSSNSSTTGGGSKSGKEEPPRHRDTGLLDSIQDVDLE